MFVIFHVNYQSEQFITAASRKSVVKLRQVDGPGASATTKDVVGTDGLFMWVLRNDVWRTIHNTHLTSLSPNTTYAFTAGNEAIGFSKEILFRTLPSDSSPLRLVFGGDTGLDDPTEPVGRRFSDMLKAATAKDPHAMILGGDLPYDNAMPTCYAVWDAWLLTWTNTLINTHGKLIPLITSIGNHDSGRLHPVPASLTLPMMPTLAPFYHAYFIYKPDTSTDIDKDSKESLAPWSRPTFHSHQLGSNLTILCLDTNHYNSTASQIPFIKSEALAGTIRLASYHVPMFPSRRPIDDNALEIRQNWGPAFKSAGIIVGFEHHDHTLKATKPVDLTTFTAHSDSSSSSPGMLFVGDGGMGTTTDDDTRVDPIFQYTMSRIPHFWFVTTLVTPTNLSVTLVPIGWDGAAIKPEMTKYQL
jgi:hypothetical protein